jgi:hypothetical protein
MPLGSSGADRKSGGYARTRCGQCEACLKPDCGQCIECTRKKKFGGDGSSKQACLLRRCADLRAKASSGTIRAAAAATTAANATTNANATPRPSFTNSSSSDGRRFSDTVSTASTPHSSSRQGQQGQQNQQEESPFVLRPTSLLEEPPFPTKRPRLALPAASKTTATTTTTHMYGLPIPCVPVGVCTGCGLGGKNDPHVVLLCDGPHCGREYHLKCCIPPLTQVPEGSFYCVDCSPTGTTHLLEQYLEESYDRKQELDNPQEYVKFLLEEDVQEEDGEPDDDPLIRRRLPVSELHQVHQNPEQLIGHSLRLYCPRGNHYHNGRILEIRKEEENIDLENNNDVGDVGDHDTLCLVRFPAGSDHRKTSLTTWIYLEEHCVAVCTQLVWGLIGSSKSKGGKRKVRTWMPAKLWSRTARELVPVATLLDESQGQIQFHPQHHPHPQVPGSSSSSNEPIPPIPPSPPVWGLVETFGQDTYELLNLKTEIKEQLEDEDMKHTTNNNNNSSSGVNKDPLLLSLARAEWHELERVRHWKSLPLRNPVHPQALQSRDEYGLGTLEYQDRRQPSLLPPPSTTTTTTTPSIGLCPSIAQGLDRAYILQQLSSQLGGGVEAASRDVAASLQCELVESVPDAIQALTKRDRTQT